jgi:hypothetical protein
VKNKFIDWSGEDSRYGVGRSGIRYFIQTGTGASYGTHYPTWVQEDGTRYLVPIGDADEFDGTIRASKSAARKFEQRRQQRQPASAGTTAPTTRATPTELREQTTWYRNALVHWPDGINADVYRATISVLERAATTIEQTR